MGAEGGGVLDIDIVIIIVGVGILTVDVVAANGFRVGVGTVEGPFLLDALFFRHGTLVGVGFAMGFVEDGVFEGGFGVLAVGAVRGRFGETSFAAAATVARLAVDVEKKA